MYVVLAVDSAVTCLTTWGGAGRGASPRESVYRCYVPVLTGFTDLPPCSSRLENDTCLGLAVGGWRLAVGGWRLAVGGWRLAVGGWRLAVGGWRLAVRAGLPLI
jgi:hypothetical protein